MNILDIFPSGISFLMSYWFESWYAIYPPEFFFKMVTCMLLTFVCTLNIHLSESYSVSMAG